MASLPDIAMTRRDRLSHAALLCGMLTVHAWMAWLGISDLLQASRIEAAFAGRGYVTVSAPALDAQLHRNPRVAPRLAVACGDGDGRVVRREDGRWVRVDGFPHYLAIRALEDLDLCGTPSGVKLVEPPRHTR